MACGSHGAGHAPSNEFFERPTYPLVLAQREKGTLSPYPCPQPNSTDNTLTERGLIDHSIGSSHVTLHSCTGVPPGRGRTC
jgi:hypothetical protein